MWVAFLSGAGCADRTTGPPVLAADVPLHLEDHLGAATVEGSELPNSTPWPVEWRFDEPQADWKPAPLWGPPYGPPVLTRTADALRVALTEGSRVSYPRGPTGTLRGAIYVDVPDWNRGGNGPNTDPAGAIPAKIKSNGYKYKFVGHKKLGEWIEAAAKAAGTPITRLAAGLRR